MILTMRSIREIRLARFWIRSQICRQPLAPYGASFYDKIVAAFRLGDHYPTHPQAMLLANSLAQLLDQLYNADASAVALRDLLPDDFSSHWQDILALLTILIERWPIFWRMSTMDTVDRRNSFIRWQAQHWQKASPIINCCCRIDRKHQSHPRHCRCGRFAKWLCGVAGA